MSDSGEHSCMLLGEVTSAGTADESSSEYHVSISAASETAGSIVARLQQTHLLQTLSAKGPSLSLFTSRLS